MIGSGPRSKLREILFRVVWRINQAISAAHWIVVAPSFQPHGANTLPWSIWRRKTGITLSSLEAILTSSGQMFFRRNTLPFTTLQSLSKFLWRPTSWGWKGGSYGYKSSNGSKEPNKHHGRAAKKMLVTLSVCVFVCVCVCPGSCTLLANHCAVCHFVPLHVDWTSRQGAKEPKTSAVWLARGTLPHTQRLPESESKSESTWRLSASHNVYIFSLRTEKFQSSSPIAAIRHPLVILLLISSEPIRPFADHGWCDDGNNQAPTVLIYDSKFGINFGVAVSHIRVYAGLCFRLGIHSFFWHCNGYS